mmetsp:Transcript_47941/g.111856  ORF Transcript_47941/g.111856 Transcript_47941/m.111856 type:complete len:276 (+) Transcript_47941:52-879(+)
MQANSTPERKLSLRAFRQFRPLLEVAEAYAQRSGGRFIAEDFKEECADSCCESLSNSSLKEAAKAQRAETVLEAAGAVKDFACRVREGDASLIEEFERAFHWMMVESVRNSMIATAQRLELWPPLRGADAVEADDCSYEDVSAPLCQIAQKLYNDEKRRQLLVSLGAPCELKQRAITATFIVDFVLACGAQLPVMSETLAGMRTDFATRVMEWESAVQVCSQHAGVSHGSNVSPELICAAAALLGPVAFVATVAGFAIARNRPGSGAARADALVR